MSNFPEQVQVYLVGGAVRDKLLGLPVKDQDYVVVGATPELMRTLGFKPVGQAFPVFLHPETGEEYALARTERKTGQGHQGFSVSFAKTVTLNEDLSRRDLTINALAQTVQGELIDPYNGQEDLKSRVLRHISSAFSEDPLRVLRLTRFHAKLAPLGFAIHPQTWALAQQMVTDGELDHLTPERIWMEVTKALECEAAAVFFKDLYDLGAIHVLGLPAELPSATFLSMQTALQTLSQHSQSPPLRFAAWLEPYPAGGKAIAQQLPLPKPYRYWLALFAKHAHTLRQWATATPIARWQVFKQTHSLRDAGDIMAFARALALPAQTLADITACQQQLHRITPRKWIDQGLTGQALGEALKAAQLAVLANKVNHNETSGV